MLFDSNTLHSSVDDPALDRMNFLNEITFTYPDAVSFAPGRPYDGFFEIEDIHRHLRRYAAYLADRGASPAEVRRGFHQYGPTAGQIRELIAHSLQQDEGFKAAPEAIVVTVGAQEAMFLTLRALFADPEDVLLLVTPCYVGIIGAARLLDVPVVSVPERDGRLVVADLDDAVRSLRSAGRRPKALYVVPDYANPTGSTLDLPTRTALLAFAERHGLLILEDSPYRLTGAAARLPMLKALDESGCVIQLGTYSKTVFPGARVGYVLADQEVRGPGGEIRLLAEDLAKIKSMITVNTSSLSQAIAAGALLSVDGRLSELNAEAAERYSRSMAGTLAQLDRRLPEARRHELGVDWNRPNGGFFLTLRTSFRTDIAALERSAREFGVIWTPMEFFYPHGGGEQDIRMSISYLTSEEIELGVERLVRFIETETTA
ncbi:PLP-dependent aminotransferase family protein [Actinospica sp. MGRD01-02]|uniref:PLP-dependent aminotransferase family protein n=1 Tax=Actinospica acidithermotolerans TaxID=2828514 RepID=A0A941E7B8_9ACTN|nr:PLP-dependent aminotransferase family protein [Actinospica acidithermotolerans]MBR7826381.1 PLP-dependent aminotransferase family protein [Actinospica acidithermotolerans]